MVLRVDNFILGTQKGSIASEKTNLFFAVGVYPKEFGFFRGDIEEYLDIIATVSPGRVNEID